jgi:hypothetical protein
VRPGVLHAPKHFIFSRVTQFRVWVLLSFSIKNSFTVRRFVRPQLRELIIHLQFWLHSSLFLLVFFDSEARISLLGEVSRATLVDNLRRRGAAIAGFGTCCSEAGSNCRISTNRELTKPFKRLGTLVHISW